MRLGAENRTLTKKPWKVPLPLQHYASLASESYALGKPSVASRRPPTIVRLHWLSSQTGKRDVLVPLVGHVMQPSSALGDCWIAGLARTRASSWAANTLREMPTINHIAYSALSPVSLCYASFLLDDSR